MQVAVIRQQFGLNQPILFQYRDWLWRALHLDFGRSFYFRDTVIHLIADRLSVTLELGSAATLLAAGLAVPLGVIAAVNQGRWIDRACLFFAVLGQAMPSFWLGLTLVIVFAVDLHWLPASGNAGWRNFVLPVVTLAYYAMPAVMRLTRDGMLDVLCADYIRTAHAKGLSGRRIVFRHALRNAIVPVVALTAVQLGFMLGGSIVIETVFALQGVGQLAWDSISRNDFPVVQAIVLILAVIYIALTLVADLTSALLDPRLRLS